MTVRSRYKIIPLILALYIMVVLGVVTYFLIRILIINPGEPDDMPLQSRIGLWIWLVMNLLLLRMLLKDTRRVRMDNEKIVFINLFFPFIRRTYRWKKIDSFLVVTEQSARGGAREAIWLIKKRRLKTRITSFYFSNYYDLQDAVCVPYQGQPYINSFRQILCYFRLCKVPVLHRRRYR